eukprot:6912505-Alexandrium_andersonii.AAC.1
MCIRDSGARGGRRWRGPSIGLHLAAGVARRPGRREGNGRALAIARARGGGAVLLVDAQEGARSAVGKLRGRLCAAGRACGAPSGGAGAPARSRLGGGGSRTAVG